MIFEIEVEDVGIVRPLNAWQIQRCKRARGPHARLHWAAASVCMSFRQFSRLPVEKQREVVFAYDFLGSVRNTGVPGKQDAVTVTQLIRALMKEQQQRAA
jgi:hypothetical protein